MPSFRFLIVVFAIMHCLHGAAAARHPLIARQDDSASATRADDDASASAATSTAQASREPESSAAPSKSPAPTNVASRESMTASMTVTVSSSVMEVPATVTSNEPVPTASSSAETGLENPLPIHPKVTPAMGVAGAILILSGVVYAVIGIKNKLYVFFSAAYLTSLAVTVLIVYLMNPPVTDAIQGAFFVAAFFSGIIFGAVSLVFSDITEGLGCMLGGFCVSMWLLTTKEGGLISSTTGRAIFIGCFSAAGYSLSFSHYTRTYGLIGCISFAGATVTMLGIDCLSRAGWKEFWLYLWDLNPDTFPLNTNTYPITRGIRVEIACVVLITVFGIISQLRLWKLIKERREKSTSIRIERERQQEQEEEEMGRRIEDDFAKERAQWEATYGDKTVSEASEDTKSTNSVKVDSVSDGRDTEALKIGGVVKPGANDAPTGATYTVTVMDDEIQPVGARGEAVNSPRRVSDVFSEVPTGGEDGVGASSGIQRSTSTKVAPPEPVPPPPAVVPLPFKVPEEDEIQSQGGDNASVSALPESIHETLSNRRSVDRRSFVKRLSGISSKNRFSAGRPSGEEHDLQRLMTIPHNEEDRRSSVAATLDDDIEGMSLPDLSPPHSPVGGKPGAVFYGGNKYEETDFNNRCVDQMSNANSSDTENDGGLWKVGPEGVDQVDDLPASRVRQSLTISTDPKVTDLRSKQGSLIASRRRSDTVTSPLKEDGEATQQSKSSKAGSPSVVSRNESGSGSLKAVLPDKLSKVALSYRTNEWAKHLEAADKPELDTLNEPASPGVQLSPGLEEQPAPISKELIEPLYAAKRGSKRVSSDTTAYRNSKLIRSDSNHSRISHMDPHVHSRAPSALAAGGIVRSGSVAQNKRSSSTPTAPTYSTGPLSPSFPNAEVAGPSLVPSSTLMGERNALVRSRVTSPTPHPSQNLVSVVAEHENLTLAQRRRLLQTQKPPTASQPWQQSRRVSSQVPGFDSHQPTRRTSGAGNEQRREALLAGWREQIRQEATPTEMNTASSETRRAAILNGIRQKEMEREVRERESQQREAMMGNMMRSDQMIDAHREAMRRMQAAANKKA